MYRLSDHSLATETGRHQKTWLPKERRLFVHCNLAQVETEAHFLLSSPKCLSITNQYFPKFTVQNIKFEHQSEPNQIKIIMGEEDSTVEVAAQYISACHNLTVEGLLLFFLIF